MKILVTGATGFVGKALVPYLAAQGHEVIAVARRTSDVVEGAAQIHIVRDMQIADWATDWAEALAGVDAVIHLAARVHQMNDTSIDPLAEFRAVNRDSTIALAKAAAACGVKRFVFLSSVKAAADETDIDGVDETIPPAPASPYGISKREAEEALLAIDGLDVVILRPPLIYGPGVKANFRLLVKLAGLPIPLPLGGIRNRRSLLGLTNLVQAIGLAVATPRLGGRVFYLSDGDPVSTPDLIRHLAGAMNRRAIVLPVPVGLLRALARILGQGDKIDRLTESLVVSNAAFRMATGWKPEPMARELERVVASAI